MQKLLTFFSKNINIYAIFNDQSFKNTLTNDIVSFEQPCPGFYLRLGVNNISTSLICSIVILSQYLAKP